MYVLGGRGAAAKIIRATTLCGYCATPQEDALLAHSLQAERAVRAVAKDSMYYTGEHAASGLLVLWGWLVRGAVLAWVPAGWPACSQLPVCWHPPLHHLVAAKYLSDYRATSSFPDPSQGHGGLSPAEAVYAAKCRQAVRGLGQGMWVQWEACDCNERHVGAARGMWNWRFLPSML